VITNGALLELSQRLSRLEGPEEFVSVSTSEISRHLPADDVLWMDTNYATQTFRVWRHAFQGHDSNAENAMPGLLDHPAIQSYIGDPQDLSPRRLSDVSSLRDRHHREALTLSQRHLGRHQLSMIVEADPAGVGKGWVLSRRVGDFTEDDLESASRLLPILLGIYRASMPRGKASFPDQRRNGVASCDPELWRRLSPRENEVVDLLVGGLTAYGIGSVLGISHRTVRKHLEHIYEKMGTHDRLSLAMASATRRDSAVRQLPLRENPAHSPGPPPSI
jgi:DNA-binding CsgD family transcriptional regulator